MNFKTFMQKLDGKQNETIDSATVATGTLDVQSIMRIARGLGYFLASMEERSDFPNGIQLAFDGGQRGFSCDALGLYLQYPSYFRTELEIIQRAGEWYSQQSNGDTPSSVQEGVPVAPEQSYERADWAVTSGDIPYVTWTEWAATEHQRFERENRDTERATVGSATSDTLSGPEPTGDDHRFDAAQYRTHARGLRETLGEQESGVSGVRNERESRERSPEDTRESLRRSMERESGR